MKRNMRYRHLCIGIVVSLVLLMAACSAPKVAFEGKTLADGQVGVAYSQNIANGEAGITYAVHYEDMLPTGLQLSEDGTISGTPEKAESQTFTVVAMTEKDMLEADFTIAVLPGSLSFTAKDLPDATVGTPYIQSVATASGADNVVYTLKEGCNLPAGLSLSESGELSGIPEAAAAGASFTVLAGTDSTSAAEAAFTLNVAEGTLKSTTEGRIIFEAQALPAGEVGTEYYQNIGTAYGVPGITYQIQYVDGIGLPKGLEFNPLGILHGTPLDSTAGEMTFKLTASAEGYEPVAVDCSLQISDVYVQTSRFEAEHIDVSKLKGAGYSSSPTGTGMLQKFANASNGYTLGYLHKAISFDFFFTSDKAASGTLTLGLGTETGTISYTPESLVVRVNGTPVDYGTITVEEKGSGQSTEFTAITLAPGVALVEGENIITIEIKDTLQAGGDGTMTAVGPVVDYVEVQADGATLGWRPKVANTK